MPDTDTTPATDTSAPNPFAGKSLEDLVTPPAGMQSSMEGALHNKIQRDDAIMSRTEAAASDHAAEMEHWHAAQGANLHDVKRWDQKAEQQKYAYEPLEAFGSFGSVFAIAASLFTKTPMENALNGAAAAMNAVKNGKEEDFKHAYTAWKDNNELAIKRGQMMHEQYQEALELMKTDYTRGSELLKNSATRFGDQQALVLMENGMSKELWEAVGARANALGGMAKAHEEMQKDEGIAFRIHNLKSDPNFYSGSPEEKVNLYDRYFGVKEGPEEVAVRNYLQRNPKSNGEELVNALAKIHREFNTGSWQNQAYQRWVQEHPNATSEETTEFMRTLTPRFSAAGNFQMLSAADIETQVDRALEGDNTAGRFSVRDPNRIAFQHALDQRIQSGKLNAKQAARANARAAGLASEERALGGQAGRSEGQAAQAFLSADLAIEKSERVPRTQFVPFNRLAYMAKRAGSDSALAELDTATNTLVTEYVRAVSGAGVPTDAAREHAYQILDQANSQETYKNVVTLLKREMQRAVEAPQRVREMLSQGKSISDVLGSSIEASKVGKIIETGANGVQYEWLGSVPPTAKTRKNESMWRKITPAAPAAPAGEMNAPG